ncbi:unnamed protein product [Brassica oleracea var. botrytis]
MSSMEWFLKLLWSCYVTDCLLFVIVSKLVWMEEIGLPERLFETGFEPTGRKRINNYFNLRWIQVIKDSLTYAQNEMLVETQFRQLLQMGHHTFSVMFGHQILSRQLVTAKEYELWWLLAGKPIRYGIGEFALVTGLNCNCPPPNSLTTGRVAHPKKQGKGKGKLVPCDGPVWKSLFGSDDKITPSDIIKRLAMREKYKDDETRLRLALLLLVEGILCPTSGSTNIRAEVVEMLADMDGFLKYPWGRESFILTIRSVKGRSPAQYASDTIAIQGFAHAIVLVTVCCCPQIICESPADRVLLEEDVQIEDIVEEVCSRSLKINVVTSRNLEVEGQATVTSILCPNHSIDGFRDEVTDVTVTHMVALINNKFPFEHNSWSGGVKAVDAKRLQEVGDDVGLVDENARGSNFQPDSFSPYHTAVPESHVGHSGSTGAPSEDVEARVLQVVGSLKSHFDTVLSGVKNSLSEEIKQLKDMLLRYTKDDRSWSPHFSTEPEEDGQRCPPSRMEAIPETSPPPLRSTFGEHVDGGLASGTQPGRNHMIMDQHNVGPSSPPLPFVATCSVQPALHSTVGGTGDGDVPAPPQAPPLTALSKSFQSTSKDIQFGDQSASDDEDISLAQLRRKMKVSTTGHILSSTTVDVPSEHAGEASNQILTHLEETGGDGDDVATCLPAIPRKSTRLRKRANRYTPPVDGGKKTKLNIAETEQTVEKIVQMDAELPQASTHDPIGTLLSGFSPFVGLNAFRVAAFQNVTATQFDCNGGEGATISNVVFKDVFHGTRPLHFEAADMVVSFIRHRNLVEGSHRFEFLPSVFLRSLIREFRQAQNPGCSSAFNFTTVSGVSLPSIRRWCVDIDVLYCPFQIDGQHWVGVSIDLKQWCIHVLDCNTACVSETNVENALHPISVIFPELVKRYGGPHPRPGVLTECMPVERLDINLLCEITDFLLYLGLSCVVSVILLELHATKKLHLCEHITEGCIRTAGERYAVEAFATFNPQLLAP